MIRPSRASHKGFFWLNIFWAGMAFFILGFALIGCGSNNESSGQAPTGDDDDIVDDDTAADDDTSPSDDDSGNQETPDIIIWTADGIAGSVKAFDKTGTQIAEATGFVGPRWVSVTSSGGVWVAEMDGGNVFLLNVTGNELIKVEAPNHPISVSYSPFDGTCWVGDTDGKVWRFDDTGNKLTEVSELGSPAIVSAKTFDGSCWAIDSDAGGLYRITADATVQTISTELGSEYSVLACNADPKDCWIADFDKGILARFSAQTLTEELRIENLYYPKALDVDPQNGDVWVGIVNRTLLYSREGETKLDLSGFYCISQVAADPVDHSAWVADLSKLYKISPTGAILIEIPNWELLYSVSVGILPSQK